MAQQLKVEMDLTEALKFGPQHPLGSREQLCSYSPRAGGTDTADYSWSAYQWETLSYKTR